MDAYDGPDAALPGEARPETANDWADPNSDDVPAQLAYLRRRIEQNDDEIDAMQIAAAQAQSTSRKWWREPAVLISVLSLALAFGTTLVSSVRLDEERRHEARNELTGYIERLADIPRQQAEVMQQHPDANGANLASQLGTELLSIANQARSVISTIPNDVSTGEYISVGYAFQNQGALEDADALYQQALLRAVNKNDRVFALRSIAGTAFLRRDYAAARDNLGKAMAIYADDKTTAQIVIDTTNASTAIFWAAYELQAGNCAEASAEVDVAQQIVSSGHLTSMQLTVDQARAGLPNCVPSSTPVPATPGAS